MKNFYKLFILLLMFSSVVGYSQSDTIFISLSSQQESERKYNEGISFYNQGELEKAMSSFDASIRLNPEFYQAYYNRGVILLEIDDYIAAIKDFNYVIEKSPTSLAYYSRGRAEYEQGNIDFALADYSMAIDLDETNYLAYYYRASIYFDRKEYDKSLEDLNWAIFSNANYAYAFNDRGSVYLMLNEYDKSIKDYQEAIRL